MRDLVEEAAELQHIWEHLTPLAELKDSPEILSHLKGLLTAVRESEPS